jgi:hypothetical protein
VAETTTDPEDLIMMLAKHAKPTSAQITLMTRLAQALKHVCHNNGFKM